LTEKLDQVRLYHQSTKHLYHRFARGPGRLDWATQPDPFRRYEGADLIDLDQIPRTEQPLYEAAFVEGQIEPAPLNRRSVSQLFFDSLALSAWKRAENISWALRVNPSSGNLHPTEGYLFCGPVESLTELPVVAHYAPREHALEVRAELPLATWQALTADLPPGAILLGLSSIHWREAWKYGERAFRYCQLDVGHAMAAISIAAAGLGWQAALMDDLGSKQIAGMLGISTAHGVEPEHPDCLLAIYPQGQLCPQRSLPQQSIADFAALTWQGEPNQLSRGHAQWSIIDDVAKATTKPPTEGVYQKTPKVLETLGVWDGPSLSLRQIIRQRRSAVAMDPRGSISREAFYKILHKTLAGPVRFPFNTLPWSPLVHLVLFVHRVENLAPGLYVLVREPAQKEFLQAAMKDEFVWEKPVSCPQALPLYLLVSGDARAAARQLSCQQDIASDGCFSLGMLTEFDGPLEQFGSWFYRRFYWEGGMLGQVLYLEAEAAGIRGTGIGCFFDDPVHELLGLDSTQYQSLYHFTVGQPIEDTRLTTLPAYPAAESSG